MSIVAFASILMTYFGVNFIFGRFTFLCQWRQNHNPEFCYSIVIVALLGAISYWRYQKIFK